MLLRQIIIAQKQKKPIQFSHLKNVLLHIIVKFPETDDFIKVI